MNYQLVLMLGTLLANARRVASQTTNPGADLPGFLSAVQSLASQLSPTTTSSTSSSRTTNPSSSSTTAPTTSSSSNVPSTSSTLSSASSSIAAAATSATAASADSSGIDPRTRTIILAVAIPVGIILLAAIVLLLFCCCRRRRHKAARAKSPETAFVGNKDWEHGNNSHHGFNSTSSFGARGSKGYEHNGVNDSAPLMSSHDNHNHNNHHTGTALGAGALAGAAAAHHHNKNSHGDPYTHEKAPEQAYINDGNPRTVAGREPLIDSHDRHHNNHTGAALGAGALAGAAAGHHHNRNGHGTAYTHEKAPDHDYINGRNPRNTPGSEPLMRSHDGHHGNHTGAALGAGALAGAAAGHHHDRNGHGTAYAHEKGLDHGYVNDGTSRTAPGSEPLTGSYDENHNNHTGAVLGAGALAGAAATHHHNKNHSDTHPHEPGFEHTPTHGAAAGTAYQGYNDPRSQRAIAAESISSMKATHYDQDGNQLATPRNSNPAYGTGSGSSNIHNHNNHHTGEALGAGALAGAAAMHHHGHHSERPSPAVLDESSVHPAHRDANLSNRHSNPNAGAISRKPVPGRNSTGSNISATDVHHGYDHNGLAAGAGAFAGAEAVHQHDKHHSNDPVQNRPASWHRPLNSHPSEPSMYATAGAAPPLPDREQRRSVTPFSPDDVGAVLRSNKRNSQGAVEPTVAAQHQYPAGAILGPTNSQRKSLEKRHSGHGGDYDPPYLPSRSPNRRSLTGGGEMWQADTMDPSPMPPAYTHEPLPSASGPAALAMARQRRRSSGGGSFQQVNTEIPPALPSNRHSPARQSAKQSNYDARHESSTSDESWESAQTELNPWEYHDPVSDAGRYPRFSAGSGNTMAPLLPPAMAWENNVAGRRGSGGYRGSSEMMRQDGRRRSSGASERRQRLRFSDEQEMYNEHGLVGRAL